MSKLLLVSSLKIVYETLLDFLFIWLRDIPIVTNTLSASLDNHFFIFYCTTSSKNKNYIIVRTHTCKVNNVASQMFSLSQLCHVGVFQKALSRMWLHMADSLLLLTTISQELNITRYEDTVAGWSPSLWKIFHQNNEFFVAFKIYDKLSGNKLSHNLDPAWALVLTQLLENMVWKLD